MGRQVTFRMLGGDLDLKNLIKGSKGGSGPPRDLSLDATGGPLSYMSFNLYKRLCLRNDRLANGCGRHAVYWGRVADMPG
eukprot:8415060-Pyramimonas_sp.AAC.1